MPLDSRQIANDFIRLAAEEGRVLSILPLVKLVYVAHGWNLALRDEPLITDYAYAWKHGPVIPGVYYAFRPQGTHNLAPTRLIHLPESGEDESVIRQTYSRYGGMRPSALRNLTHIAGGPWHRTMLELGERQLIPNAWIKDHYEDKLRRLETVGQ